MKSIASLSNGCQSARISGCASCASSSASARARSLAGSQSSSFIQASSTACTALPRQAAVGSASTGSSVISASILRA